MHFIDRPPGNSGRSSSLFTHKLPDAQRVDKYMIVDSTYVICSIKCIYIIITYLYSVWIFSFSALSLYVLRFNSACVQIWYLMDANNPFCKATNNRVRRLRPTERRGWLSSKNLKGTRWWFTYLITYPWRKESFFTETFRHEDRALNLKKSIWHNWNMYS